MRAPDTLPPEVERDLAAMDAAVAGRPHADGDPLLAELAALVADSRPAPDPGWARELDLRRREGFGRPAPHRRRRRARIALPALGLAACALIALVIGLTGTRGSGGDQQSSAVGGSSSTGGGAADSSSSSGSSTAAREAAPPALAAPSTPGDPRSDARPTRKVERGASMTLGARRADLDGVAAGAARVATALGGYVASSSVSSRTGGTLDLRIPSSRLDDAVARLSRLAHVRRLERSTLDITAQSVSARARVGELRAERRSLLRQLAKATTLDETDRLRARLRTNGRQLEAARAQSRRVENRAAYGNLSVELVAERAAPAATAGWSPRDAWHDALRVLEVAAGIALVAFAVALPVALLGAPAWLAGRRLTRRRRERALDLA